MTPEQKELIVGAVETAKNNGYKIICGAFGTASTTRCCPVRALILDKGPANDSNFGSNPQAPDYIDTATSILGCTPAQAWAFVFGFDGAVTRNYYSEMEETASFWEFGQELRRKEFGE